jgi:hypothetical protein
MTPSPRTRNRAAKALVGGLFALATLAAACGDDGAPDAEFIVAAGDSTYWVRSDGSEMRLRGSPMVLARLDRRFQELYVVDEDHSFENALFVGQRLYQRDLLSGDSVEVFRDTLVRALAAKYQRRHPDARPLAPDEDTAEEPATTATAEVSVLGVHGPYLSIEYHADTSGSGDDTWHMTRHAVIDLRTGKPVALTDVLGADEGDALVKRGRALYRETVDSIRRDRRPEARRAAQSLGRFRFDPMSFSLAAPNGTLMIAFSAPGAGVGGEGFVLPMRPLAVVEPAWWTEARAALPTSTREREELWSRGSYVVKATYDTSARPVTLTLADSAGREFPIGGVSAPVHRIYWLDRPAIDRSERLALTRAFDEAATYDDASKAQSAAVEHRMGAFQPAHWSRERPKAESAKARAENNE